MCGKGSRAGQSRGSGLSFPTSPPRQPSQGRIFGGAGCWEHRGREPSISGGRTCWQEAATFKVYPIPEAGAWGLAAMINILEAGWISKFKKFLLGFKKLWLGVGRRGGTGL